MILLADIPSFQALLVFVVGFPFSFETPDNKTSKIQKFYSRTPAIITGIVGTRWSAHINSPDVHIKWDNSRENVWRQDRKY